MFATFLIAIQSPPPAPPQKRDCTAPTSDSEVVVCARMEQEQFRLRPLPDRFVQRKTGPGIERDLGNGAKLNVYSSSEANIGGQSDARVMMKFRIPF